MPLRVTKVAQVPLVAMEAGLTQAQEEKRKRALLAEFHNLCPHSKALQGSWLDTHIEHKTTGIVLEYYLNETEQASLNLANGSPIQPLGVSNDMFAIDVTLVTQEIHLSRNLIRTAVNPAIALDMLRERSLLGDQIRFIRRRLRKREAFFLPTLDDEPIAVPRLTQRFAGPAVAVQVKGYVSALFKRSVELADAEMMGDIPDQLGDIELPRRILMARASARKRPEQLITFANLLDSGGSSDLAVGVNLDWVSGRAASLNFLRFLNDE